jgi:hypothetical protein
MRAEQSRQADLGSVILFRPRAAQSSEKGRKQSSSHTERQIVADLERYQRAAEDEDYPHRMMVNAAALGFCIALAVAGVWLANQIAEMKRVEDCVLSGRVGCVALPIPAQARF